MSTISEQGDDLALQKRIRQAVYDIRYKASKEEIDLRHAYSVYIGKSGLDQNGKEAVQNKLFGKQKEDAAESAVLESAEDNKYKVVHTNKETGKTYIRFAKRSRINKLRKKGSVEITGHGVPKGSKTSSTSAVKKSGGRQSLANLASNQRSLKKYKPTKITSRSKPIKPKEKPKTVIKTVEVEKKSGKTNPSLTDKVKKMLNKEDFLADATAVAPPKNKKIGGEKVDNSKLIKVFPQDQSDPQIGNIKSSYKPVGEVVSEILAKESATPEKGTGKYYVQGNPTDYQRRNAAARQEIQRLTNAGQHKKASALHAKITNTAKEEFVDPFYKSVEDDGDDGTGRSMYAKWNNVKNRLRSMGLKCNYELEGNELIEDAVEYFYEQGITEETIDAIVEEVGLDDFVEFVLDPHQDLVEERKARKARANAPSFEKVKAAVDASDAEKQKKKTGEYSKSYAQRSGETEDSTNYNDKPAKPKAKKVKQVVASPAKKAATKKKVTVAVKKVKPTAPEKTPTKKDGIKDGLRAKITKFVKKGVERHKTAVGKAKTEVKNIAKTASDTAKQHAGHRKEFVRAIKATPKERKIAGGIGKAVKKAVTGEEVELEGKELSENPVQKAWNYLIPHPSKSANPNVRSGKLQPGKLEAGTLKTMNNTAKAINKPIKATSGAIKTVKGAADTVSRTVSKATDAVGSAAKAAGPVATSAVGGGLAGAVTAPEGKKVQGAIGGGSGAAVGAKLGSAGGPVGTAVGAAVGGLVGSTVATGGKKKVKEHHEKDADGNVIPHKTAPLTEGALVRQLLEGKA